MTDQDYSTAEQMAIAVLRGDYVAARALADLLVEVGKEATNYILPLKHVISFKNNRCVLYIKEEVWNGIDREEFQEVVNNVQRWVMGGGTRVTGGVSSRTL